MVAEAIRNRSRRGSRFSIVAVSEGAMSREDAGVLQKAQEHYPKSGKDKEKKEARKQLEEIEARLRNRTMDLSQRLESLTQLESRVTILGHLQRGGTPSAADRLLATRLGTACAALIHQGASGVMVAARGDGAEPVPLEKVVGKRRTVPLDHPWVQTARDIGVCLGDEG